MNDFKYDQLLGKYLRNIFDKQICKCIQSIHTLEGVTYILENIKTNEKIRHEVDNVLTCFEVLGENKEVIETLFK